MRTTTGPGVHELLGLDPVLATPRARVKSTDDLAEPPQDLALLETPDGPVQLDTRIEQVLQTLEIPALHEFGRPPDRLYVLLRHRLMHYLDSVLDRLDDSFASVRRLP